LFGLELAQVPHFRLFPDDKWWGIFCGFIWGLGYEVANVHTDFINVKPTVENLLLADITSDYKNFSHSLIINTDGIVVHDPLPVSPNNGRNVIDRLECWYSIHLRK